MVLFNYEVTVTQARILVPDIQQCPAKNGVMSDESCLTMDTVDGHALKKKHNLPTS